MAVAAAWAGDSCLGCDEAAVGSNYCSEPCRMQSRKAGAAVSLEPRASTPAPNISQYTTYVAAASSQGRHNPSCCHLHGRYLSLTTSCGGCQQMQISNTNSNRNGNQSFNVSSQSHIFSSGTDDRTSEPTIEDDISQQQQAAKRSSRETRRPLPLYPVRTSRVTEPHGGHDRPNGTSPHGRTSVIAWCTAWRPHNSSFIEAADSFLWTH